MDLGNGFKKDDVKKNDLKDFVEIKRSQNWKVTLSRGLVDDSHTVNQ